MTLAIAVDYATVIAMALMFAFGFLAGNRR